jgi:hypothetical protein
MLSVSDHNRSWKYDLEVEVVSSNHQIRSKQNIKFESHKAFKVIVKGVKNKAIAEKAKASINTKTVSPA